MNNNASIASWLTRAVSRLHSYAIDSARLDAELILAHTVHKPRTWLHAHPEHLLTKAQIDIVNARLKLRIDRVPLAYIIGHKEFYGRLFHVTPATLIPRPESEVIISLLSQFITPTHRTLLDVGTGSGCLGITAKLEHPKLEVALSDISDAALKVARDNARQLRADVTTTTSDLFTHISGRFDIIIANLPYVDHSWDVAPDLAHEPASALYADEDGLAIIKQCLSRAHTHLSSHGYLLLEADPCQHTTIITYAQNLGYHHQTTDGYCLVLTR